MKIKRVCEDYIRRLEAVKGVCRLFRCSRGFRRAVEILIKELGSYYVYPGAY